MWNCPKCRESVEDELDVCWNCGTSPDGTEDPAFRVVDPETAEAIRAQPPESTNPYASPQAAAGADPGLRRTYNSIRLLAVACGLGAAVVAVRFVLTLEAYFAYARDWEGAGGLGALVGPASVLDVLDSETGAFVVALASMACLLWSYAGSIRALLNDEHVTAAKLIASQSRFWNRARVAAGCSILAGVVIAFCF